MYPPVHNDRLDPSVWYGDYIETYVERDVRQLIRIQDLAAYRRFVRLCAARIGRLVNLSDLARDAGIRHNTARLWLSVPEASYIIFFLKPLREMEATL